MDKPQDKAMFVAFLLLVAFAYMMGCLTETVRLHNKEAKRIQESAEAKKYTEFVQNGQTDAIFAYWYSGKVESVVDGDTIDVSLDLGLGVYKKERIRLSGINAPEMKDAPKGLNAKNFLQSLLTTGEGKVIVATQRDKPDNYGRLLGTVFLSDGTNVNAAMIKTKQAEIY